MNIKKSILGLYNTIYNSNLVNKEHLIPSIWEAPTKTKSKDYLQMLKILFKLFIGN